jgi:hypothetical protein
VAPWTTRITSCRNRHCPKCQEDRAQEWLTGVLARLIPCDHYFLTFTLPQELRALAHAHQRVVYSVLRQEAAAAVQALAADRAWVGGQVGMLAVLQTWTRTLDYHPHAHLLVTAGGLAPDGEGWVKPAHARFLMPGYMLSSLFRAKMRDALTHTGFADQIASHRVGAPLDRPCPTDRARRPCRALPRALRVSCRPHQCSHPAV